MLNGKMPLLVSDYVFVGIDPGTTGAITVLYLNRNKPPVVFPLDKKSPQDIADFLDRIKGKKAEPFFLIEKVHGAGVAFSTGGRAGGKVMFNFGWSAGMLYGLCVRRQLAEVSPVSWQKEFALVGHRKTKKKMSSNEKKTMHQAKARRLFPELHVTQKTADSVLIALYCRRHYRSLF